MEMVEPGPVETLTQPITLMSMIEQKRPFHHDARLALGTASGLAGSDRFAPHTVSQAAANVLLRDVVLDPESGTLFQAGKLLRWASYPRPASDEAAAQRRAAKARPAPRGKLAFCGFNRYWVNWFHWLTQCVPAVAGYATSDAWRDGMLLLQEPTSADQMQALHLASLDPPEIEMIDSGHALAFDRLVFSTLLAHQFAPSPFCRDVFRRMVTGTLPPDPADSADMLYVWRADAGRRPMRNEIDLVEQLIARGVEPVIASTLSIDQKIAKFRNAWLVIGAHGAGLANIVFCRPGSVVYELMPEHWLGSTAGAGINLLAQQQGLHYWSDAHPVHGTWDEFAHFVPWTANLALVQRRLDEIARVHRAAPALSG